MALVKKEHALSRVLRKPCRRFRDDTAQQLHRQKSIYVILSIGLHNWWESLCVCTRKSNDIGIVYLQLISIFVITRLFLLLCEWWRVKVCSWQWKKKSSYILSIILNIILLLALWKLWRVNSQFWWNNIRTLSHTLNVFFSFQIGACTFARGFSHSLFYWLVSHLAKWMIYKIDSNGNWSWASPNTTKHARNEWMYTRCSCVGGRHSIPGVSLCENANVHFQKHAEIFMSQHMFAWAVNSTTCYRNMESAFMHSNSTQTHLVPMRIHSVHHMGNW